MFRTNFRVSAALGLALAAAAHADVVCIKATGKMRSIKVRAGDVCGSNEAVLGTFAGLQAVLAASSTAPAGDGTLHLDNVQLSNVQIVSPIEPPVVPPAAPETLHYCAGGGFPGEVGPRFACASDDDCNNICVTGDSSVLGGTGGYACVANSQCNTALQNDGVCALGATCAEYAAMSVVGATSISRGSTSTFATARAAPPPRMDAAT